MDLSLLQSIVADLNGKKISCGTMCEFTAADIMNRLYDTRPLRNKNGLKNLWYPPHAVEPDEQFSLFDIIERELKLTDILMVVLQNGTYSPIDEVSETQGGWGDKRDIETFSHVFCLASINREIYRIESYAGLYPAKITPWSSYKEDLQALLISVPGEDRLRVWNALFSSDETEDDNNALLSAVYTYRTRELI